MTPFASLAGPGVSNARVREVMARLPSGGGGIFFFPVQERFF
jgi:hypothetical protein